MGLLSGIIAKGVITAARNSTIRIVGEVVTNVISAKAKSPTEKEDVVVKNGITFIKPTRSDEDYYGENTLDIVKELFGAGFESITLKPIYKLSERAKAKYGRLESISINGKEEFLAVKKVPSTAYIVIEYADFKSNVDASVYNNIRKITPGTISRNKFQHSNQKNEPVTTSEIKKFCSYCGNRLEAEAKFCSCCGEKV